MQEGILATMATPPRSTRSLAELPHELLAGILAHLAVEDTDIGLNHDTSNLELWRKLKTLAHLCRTCRSFQQIVTPVLYRTFPKPHTTIQRKTRTTVNTTNVHEIPKPSRRLRCFLRTIVERPCLRPLVENIHIGRFESHVSHAAVFDHPFPGGAELSNIYHFGIRQTSLGPYHEAWARQLCGREHVDSQEPRSSWTATAGLEDAEIALLGCLVADTKRLSLQFPSFVHGHAYGSNDRPCFSLLFMTDTKFTAFSKLEELSIDSGRRSEEGHYGHDQYPKLSNLLRLPMLKTFRGSGMFDFWSNWEDDILASQIRVLSLDGCTVHPSGIDRLLGRCPMLEDLSLKFATDSECESDNVLEHYPATPDQTWKTWRSLNVSLSRSAGHLRTLSLRAPEEDSELAPSDDCHPNKESSLGSLKHFTALETLDLPQVGLLGPEWWDYTSGFLDIDDPDEAIKQQSNTDLLELLPPHLKTLIVRECSSFMVTQLEKALPRMLISSPLLRRIEIMIHPAHWEIAGQRLLDRLLLLAESFRSAGVQFVDSVKHTPEETEAEILSNEAEVTGPARSTSPESVEAPRDLAYRGTSTSYSRVPDEDDALDDSFDVSDKDESAPLKASAIDGWVSESDDSGSESGHSDASDGLIQRGVKGGYTLVSGFGGWW